MNTPTNIVRATSNGTIAGSGAEDIGFRRHEAHARIIEQRNIDAERNARDRRLDIDRIIQTAIASLESEALDAVRKYPNGDFLAYIAEDSDIDIWRFANGAERSAYIAELLAEIHAELSPLVRDTEAK